MAAGRRLLAIVAPALREEEHRDFFEEAVAVCRQLLTEYESRRQHEARRLGRTPPED